MIKAINLFFILILLSGCNPATIKPVYDSIELSYSNGWENALSLRIDSANIVRKCDYKIVNKINSVKCYCDTLSQSSIDSLNYFVSQLRKRKPDSVYEGMCQDCPWYTIIVQDSGESIETELTGEKHRNLVDSLARFILKRSGGMKNRVDSVYSFASTERLIPSPPPLQAGTKFSPPETD